MMHVCDQRQSWQLGLAGFLAVGWVYSCSGDRATAQITPDATLGRESSVVKPNVNVRGLPADLIEGGAARGANLFHSFDQFNVGKGQRVYFANPAGIENILGRVTGNNLSKILGTLGVNGGANLFLLNPNGIIFSPNAKLDVAGSFVATTAKSLVFGNGFEFSATNPQALPLLTINITPGLQYGSNQPGATITNAAHLEVGQNLTLSADTLDLQGQLSAGGDLTLKATDTLRVRDSIVSPFIASAGGQLVVQGDRNLDIFALNHSASIFSSGGDMVWRSANTVGGDAHVRAGGNFRVEQLDGNLGKLSSPHDPVFEVAGDFSLASYIGASLQILAGGSVNIPGNVTINRFGGAFNDNSVTLSDGTTLALSGTTRPTLDIRAGTTRFFGTPRRGTPTSADITIGSITLSAPDGVVFLTNQYEPNLSLAGGAIVVGEIRTDDTFGGFVGNSGPVIIDSRSGLSVTNRIDSSSASGNAGNITLIANDAISLVNSFIVSNTSGVGKGGDINIMTGQLLLSDGGKVASSTYGSGQGGNVTVNASSLVQAKGSSTNGALSVIYALAEGGSIGTAGDVTINTLILFLSDGGQVGASTFGSGDGGNLTINASSLVQVIGSSVDGRFPSGILAQAEGDSTGKAGDVTITTPILLLSDGGLVGASTFGSGDGGNLTVKTSSLVQANGTSGDGRLVSGLYSESRGTGNSTGKAGDVTITTPVLLLSDGGVVKASTFGSGDGGNLTVNASSFVQLIGSSADGQLSIIYALADPGSTGKAGDVTITTPVLLLSDGAQVGTTTFKAGNAGNLTINASSLVQVVGTSVDGRFPTGILAQAEGNSTGKAGDVTITTPILLMFDGGLVGASTFGSGDGGILTINASSLVQANGTSATVLPETERQSVTALRLQDVVVCHPVLTTLYKMRQ